MKIIARNKRANYDYELTEELTAGISLLGGEVKSTKAGHVSLKGTYAAILGGELYIINMKIAPYRFADNRSYDETRKRKLLVNKKELEKLIARKQQGLHIVPKAVGVQRGLIKVLLGIGKSQKQTDKRERIKKRDVERDVARRFRRG